jgi:hypothetical protein
MRTVPLAAVAVALIILGCSAGPTTDEPGAPVALSTNTSADTFDIRRFNTAGYNMFETFHVTETEPLADALDRGRVNPSTMVLVTETAEGNLALLTDQMAFHHIAQGTAGGKDWMATF